MGGHRNRVHCSITPSRQTVSAKLVSPTVDSSDKLSRCCPRGFGRRSVKRTERWPRPTPALTPSFPHQYSHAPIASCDPGCDCTTRQEDQPLIGLVFFCQLPRAGAASCGFLWTSSFRKGARIPPFSLSPGHSSLRPRSPLEAEVHEFVKLYRYESTAYTWSNRKRSAHPPLRTHDHSRFLSGNNSSMRLLGQEGSFSRVSISQAMGSMPFRRAVSSSD